MAEGMVDKPDNKPAPLSNESINNSVVDTAKRLGNSFIKGMVNLNKSQAQKDLEAADAAKAEKAKQDAPAKVY